MAKGKGGNVVARVEQLVRPVVEQLGYQLWDVRYEKEGPNYFLRVFIDKEGDMDTADCETVSRALDPLIDQEDPIDESYYFEVSSPGLGRRLTRPEHYMACQGKKARLRLIRPDEEGNKEYVGTLAGFVAGRPVLITADGKEKCPEMSALALAKLCDDEDLFAEKN
ncbi:MAG: ribosome maturation factor RimP [Pygmaiobacter massiliensis]|nr:ribosome maturation factor RimP [Pygmaiobacter massiliensis]